MPLPWIHIRTFAWLVLEMEHFEVGEVGLNIKIYTKVHESIRLMLYSFSPNLYYSVDVLRDFLGFELRHRARWPR